jgi:methionyl-tRNA formyltransferase
MKNKSLILLIGESTGLECLKKLLNLGLLDIFLVVSVDIKYHKIIRKICKNNQINFITSNKFKDYYKKIKFLDNKNYFLISIFSNLIIKKDFLKKFNKKAFNFHPGLLPYYPGKNCVSGALYNNEKVTGVTLHLMSEKVDRGLIIDKKKIKIFKKDNLLTLMYKLKLLGVKLFNQFIKDLSNNKKILYRKNNILLNKNFPKKIPKNGLISKKIKYFEFNNLVRASNFGPYKNTWGNMFFLYGNKKKYIKSVNEYFYLKKKKNKQIEFVKKINSNTFNLKIEKKIIQVFTN